MATKSKHVALIAVAIFLGLSAAVGAQTAVGYYTRYREQAAASVPTPASSAWQNCFVNSATHTLYCKDSSGTSTAVGSGGGGGTFATSYSETPSDNLVTEDSTGGELVLKYQGIGTAQTSGLTVESTTAATSGNQKNSPMIEQCGAGYGTDGAASQSVCAGWQVTPVQGGSAAADYSLYQQNGGGSLSHSLEVAYDVANSTSSGMTVIGQGTGASGAISFDTNNSGELYFWAGIASARADQYPFMQIGGNGLMPWPDSFRFLGYANHRWVYADLLDSGGNKGTCDATTRGATTTLPSGTGVGDTLVVCMKGTADTYAWRTVFTAP